MRSAKTTMSVEYVREMLHMPDDWEIVNIQLDYSCGAVTLTVCGENIPGTGDRIICNCTRHEEGESFTWKEAAPAKPIDPNDPLMRKLGKALSSPAPPPKKK